MRNLRNLAIIAHVDHGKTTLVDKLLQQSGTFAAHEHVEERVMDSNDLERERGITILAKNCAVRYRGTHINIVDTPGHADFGGEVERVLSMVDAILLLVPVRDEDAEAPLQLQICSLDYSSYVGKIGIGRIRRGRLRAAQEVLVLNGPDAAPLKAKVNQVLMFEGLERQLVDEAEAGDIVLVNGIDELGIGSTPCDVEHPDA